MSTILQQIVREYLDKTGLSIAAFERKAGLKLNVVRNILLGRSKQSNIEIYVKISRTIGCPVQELLEGKKEPLKDPLKEPSKPSFRIDHPELGLEALDHVLNIVQERGYQVTTKQLVDMLEEIYVFSLKKDPPACDPVFIEWLVTRTLTYG